MSIFSGILQFIAGTVGDQRENKPEDVRRVKSALDRLGYFDFAREPEPHGYVTREMDAGLRRYQKDRGLRVDGWLKPGGETEKALLEDLTWRVSDDIQREEVPPPNIPGTNIPDKGVPEDYVTPRWRVKQMDDFRYSLDKDIERRSRTVDPYIFTKDVDILGILKSKKR